MTSSNGIIFRVIGPLSGEFTGEFPAQRPVKRSFDVFFDLLLNKWLSKPSWGWGWWFEAPSRPFKCHSNDLLKHWGCRQNDNHFADIFKCIFLNENVWISNKISLKFVPCGQIDDKSALVRTVAWCRTDDKPLSEPTMADLTDTYMHRSPSLN